MLNKKNISDYLDFLGKRANELSSKDRPTDDDLRTINLEVRKFLKRLEESQFNDRAFISDVSSLKFSVDEMKTSKRHWVLYSLVYGILRFFPGAIVVHEKDKSDAKKRKRKLIEFENKVEQLSGNLDRYNIFTDA